MGVLSRRGATDGERTARVGVEGATELAREMDGADDVRALSAGGAGSTIAHPNKDVMTAISDGFGCAGVMLGIGFGTSLGDCVWLASGDANVGNMTEDIVDSNDCT